MVSVKKSRVLYSDIILAIIALAAMNFLLYGSYIVLFAFLMCLIWRRTTVFNGFGFICLIALAICYILFDAISSNNMNFRIIAAPCAFLVAYNLDSESKKYEPTNILTLIAYAMALHSIISFIYMLRTQGLAAFSSGQSYDIWSGTLSTATGIAAYYYFMAATIPILLMKAKWHHYVLFIVCLLHDVLIGGRTFIVLSGIAVIATFVLRTYYGKKQISKFLKYIIIFGIIVGIIAIFYKNNIFNIRSTFESSYMWRRFFAENAYEEIGDTSRWTRKIIYLQNLLEYPFGGNHIKNDLGIGYAHDIWLDTFDKVGIITMLIMLMYTISSVFRFFKYAKLSNGNLKEKVVFCIFPIILMSSFFVEPIMDGAPIVFFMYCFMDGLICKKIYSIRSNS